jgi:sec-independent protein translocase protein TatB
VGNIGFQEILVIAVIALIVFGPDRLPELAREAGKLVGRFRRETSKSVAELKRAAEFDDLDRELREMRSELRQLGRDLSSPLDEPRRDRRRTPAGGTEEPRRTPPPTDPEAT